MRSRVTVLQSLLLAIALAVPPSLAAQSFEFPASFTVRDIPANGTTIHVRVGGSGPAVILLHGYGDTGDMWVPLAQALATRYRVVVPDLRGMGLSARADQGFTKRNQAEDVAGVLDALGIREADVVAHDIGNMVAFAFAAWHPDRVTKLVLMDAPVPGVGPWEEVLKNPLLWHFRFGGPDMERLVAGRERIYLDRFWNDFSAVPARFTEAERNHYAVLYARPGAMHAGFSQFAAFDQDAIDNRAQLAKAGRLQMPVLAVGGEKSFGAEMAWIARFAADDVRGAVIPDAGHWLMEEQPAATVAVIERFLAGGSGIEPRALSRAAVDALPRSGAGAGTSGHAGIETTIIAGDPTKPGPYTIAIRVPPHTKIEAHTHKDDRVATVISGEWHFGYGSQLRTDSATTLVAGGYYTEPAGAPHFAFTGSKPTVVYVSGTGPTNTVNVAATPR